MKRWVRWIKHRWTDESDLRRALPAALVERLEARIRASEQGHAGEICLCVEAGLPLSYLRRGLRARDRALTLFGKLRVWDTEANNGVLIYLLLADRAIEIIADRGLNSHVTAAHWQQVLAPLREALREQQYEAGLLAAIDAVEALLRQHFPLAEGQRNPNELPDAVVLLA